MAAPQPLDRLVDDVGRDAEQQDRVDQRGKDLHAVQPKVRWVATEPALVRVMAASDIPRPPASESRASEPDKTPTTGSTTTKEK